MRRNFPIFLFVFLNNDQAILHFISDYSKLKNGKCFFFFGKLKNFIHTQRKGGRKVKERERRFFI